MMETEKTFKTKDYLEAAVLLTHDIRLVQLHKNGSVYFIFEDKGRTVPLIESYWRGDLSVRAKKFANAIKESKDLVYKTIRNSQEYGGFENAGQYSPV